MFSFWHYLFIPFNLQNAANYLPHLMQRAYKALFWSTFVFSSFGLSQSGADPGFLERGFIHIKVWGFALLILSHFFFKCPMK